jgi:hypothetical protein
MPLALPQNFWDGTGGAIIGGLASLLVAFVVLWGTRHHERTLMRDEVSLHAAADLTREAALAIRSMDRAKGSDIQQVIDIVVDFQLALGHVVPSITSPQLTAFLWRLSARLQILVEELETIARTTDKRERENALAGKAREVLELMGAVATVGSDVRTFHGPSRKYIVSDLVWDIAHQGGMERTPRSHRQSNSI